ncbi:luciferin 4-monooxygenase [Bombus vosnesenskii]|uniref:Luciferin 4-monooxygenase n=3 Tax=Pyrobombus TaxID=144703 RepID=A0A6J3K3K9_9HYME|nr:luciferin 4-monooxygenase [Bombus impatiens]XP_012240594.1 luciferin 4-monooxygenase [Bombus impatiens]XP_012240595.1 luciferin 4-monooxygenase [Bombus impatiens]XP_033188856.1 luciferin 4-monooxygenase [Bombus vancouverensis nearcticus]XP_033188857.1 luciferin 4-monooxygenase [Bombus vancouverensis nearcticus]XP_033314397.1 luciferin 4-monooxygenase [Bombus bifarius]XP_033347692.1 luciferin 4-monooxygenase [Bombus vosnesenskii]XP_033347693.1 luciferin 4-monooxygenase [Bombus vosnesenskii
MQKGFLNMQEKNILHGPPLPDLEFKNITLGQLILNQLSIRGSWVAQINAYTGKSQTFKDILDISRKLAIAFNREGLKKDDRIAICSENNLEFCPVVCAAFYLGITVCPLNPLYTERELKHALNISKPKYIFVSAIGAKNIYKVIPQLFWLPKLIMLTEAINSKLPSIKTLTSNIIIDNNFHACSVDVNDHVTVISCSSGTTGLPKGVMLTDKNFLSVIKNLAVASPNIVNTNTTGLALLPFFHVYSFSVMLVALVFGNKNVILPRFEEKLFLHAIEKYKIEHITVVPPLMVFLAKHPIVDKYNLSSIKEIWCGAAPLSEEIAKMVVKRLNMPIIKQGYGLTETTLAVMNSPDNNTKYTSVGTLVPGVSAKVIPIDGDESSKPLGPNNVGELCFKGDIIMKGYCDNEQATAATIDKDGWLHSGDVGYYDEQGYFYIVDRMKELIKYKGFQVPPAELEAILLTCPEIKDAAVIGLPHEEAGELPAAFVVKQEGSNITAEDIIKFVNERVSSHKRLRGGVKFIENIPRTASGKILRRILHDTLKSKL